MTPSLTPATRPGRIVAAVRREPALSYSFAASGAIQVLNVLTGIVLARVLGPSGRGALAAVILWPSVLATFGSLGAIEATTYRAAQSRSLRDIRALAGTTLALGGFQSVVLVAAGVVALPFLLSRYDPEIVATGRVFLAYIPVYLTAMYVMSIVNARGQSRAFHGLRAFVAVAYALGLVFLAATGNLSISSAAATYLAVHLGVLVGSGVALWHGGVRKLSFDRALPGPLLGYGVRSHMGNAASFLNERLDQLVISALLAPVSLGLYVVAVTMTSLISLVGSSISLVALPLVAASRGTHKARESVRNYVRFGLFLSAVAAVPLFLLAPFLIELFFGHPFRAATGPARILVVAAVPLSTGRVLAAVLRGLGRPLDAGIAELFALGMTAIALAVLLPAMGLVGAALASLAAYICSLAWMAWRTAQALSVHVVELLFAPRPPHNAVHPTGTAGP